MFFRLFKGSGCSIVETLICALIVNKNIIPPTINYETSTQPVMV